MITFGETAIDGPRFKRISAILKGDIDAINVMHMLRHVSHIWDDLIDRDKDVRTEDVSGAFWIALFTLPTNPFWARHQHVLLPVLRSGTLGWLASNELELDMDTPLAREVAHVCRFDAADVLLLMAEIIGGTQWAVLHAAEIKLLVRDEPFADYISSLEARP